MLDGLTAETSDPALAAELDRTRSFLGALVGLRSDGSLYEQLEPKLRFENTLGALVTLVKAESLHEPVWLELEDAHWLDDDSQTLITNLTRALAGFPVMIVCAARPDDEGRPARFAVAEDTPVCIVDLAALTPDGTRTYAEQVLAQPVGDELAAFVYERTGGNPFFVEQLLLDLRERGLIENKEQGTKNKEPEHMHRFSAEVPDTLNSLLVARLDRLAEPVREVVQTAAVLGREWALPVLAAMRSSDDDLPPKVRAAEDGRVWSPLNERDYLFRHVLLRDAAYSMQARERLHTLHRRAAQVIEQEYAENLAPQYVALVYHAREAEDRERERRYAKLAGEAAAARYANAEAITFLSRALELTAEEDVEERWEVLLAREQVEHLQGARSSQASDIVLLTHLAEQLGTRQQAEVLLRHAEYANKTSDYETALDKAQRAVALAQTLGNSHYVAMGYLAWAWALWSHADFPLALAQLEQALSHARKSGSTGVEAEALRQLGVVVSDQGNYTSARTYYAQALNLFRTTASQQGQARTLNYLAAVLDNQGDYAGAHAYFAEALAIFQTIGDRHGEALALGNLGVNAQFQANYAQTRAYFEQALRIFQAINDQNSMAKSFANLGEVAAEQGDYVAAKEYGEQALELFHAIGNRQGIGQALNLLAEAALQGGDVDAALIYAQQTLHQTRETGNQLEELRALNRMALLSLRMGDHIGAAASSRHARERARTLEAGKEQGRALTLLGRALEGVVQFNEAQAMYTQAADLQQAFGEKHRINEARAGLARVALLQCDLTGALTQVEEIVAYLTNGGTVEGTDEPMQIYMTCYNVLHAANDPRAPAVLADAYGRLQARAARLPDEAARRMFLENVPHHRELVAAWQAAQARPLQLKLAPRLE